MKMEGKKQKYALIAALMLVLVGVIWWNCALNAPDKTQDMQDESGKGNAVSFENIKENSVETAAGSAAGMDYFDSFREERESVRALELQYLNEIIAASASDTETLADAEAQKLSIVNNMEAEFTIENLIRAKGFTDAAVTFHSGTVNVIVDAETLTEEQAAQILDIVLRETGENAENVKVIPGA
ncbi:MAG: SpoIIIAH-like family protein [Clostridiales bacterium]|nr:SpoIIIAH-like family protein [Clostridiales bacterium]